MGIYSLFNRAPTVSVLRLTGPIGSGGFGRRLDDARIGPLIERAFEPSRLAAVVLEINSPGGSPVQSALIAERIRAKADKKKVPVIAFCEDVAASGGYWLACAADEIYAHANSIVGSIGVVSASFGFDQAIARVGVERRVQTAGENKWRLDPFLPPSAEDAAWLTALQQKMHHSFISYVKERRGARLERAPEIVFSGEAFLGADAIGLGLIDGLGAARQVIEERFGEKARIVRAAPRRSFFGRMLGARGAAPLGVEGAAREALVADMAAGLIDEAERRAMMARYGL